MTKILNCEEGDCPRDFYKLESCGESHLKGVVRATIWRIHANVLGILAKVWVFM